LKGTPFKNTEIEILQNIYADKLTLEVATLLNMPIGKVYRKAAALGIKKSKEFLSSALSGRLTSESSKALNYRFKPGQVPPNKGKKQTEYMSATAIERSAKTRFVKGQCPHNALDIGTERVTKDGYIEVRVKERISSHRHWKLKQRIVYEQHYNTRLTSADVVIFNDGNKRNFEPENLVKITRAENMQRNTIHRYEPELKTAIRKVSRIKRIINNKLNSNEQK
jgi:hypothetical protein